MHYNENGSKPQETNLNGDLRWNIVYPKAKGGKPVAKPILVPSTFGMKVI